MIEGEEKITPKDIENRIKESEKILEHNELRSGYKRQVLVNQLTILRVLHSIRWKSNVIFFR